VAAAVVGLSFDGITLLFHTDIDPSSLTSSSAASFTKKDASPPPPLSIIAVDVTLQYNSDS
jgi:hypothetical protein